MKNSKKITIIFLINIKISLRNKINTKKSEKNVDNTDLIRPLA